MIFDDGAFHMCGDYGLMIGSDAPFATGRPELAGGSTAGTPVTTTTGDWNGAPAFAYSWQRCDASGGGCVPIGGATGPAYTPTGDDVGSTLRARVTATRAGRSASSDSEPTGVIAAAAARPDRAKGDDPARVTQPRQDRQERPGPGEGDLRRGLLRRGPGARHAEAGKGARTAPEDGHREGEGLRHRRGRKTLRAKLAARARRAMRRRNSLKLRLAATFTDAAGNRAEQARKGTLKRPSRRR